jgi:hypothetical protein
MSLGCRGHGTAAAAVVATTDDLRVRADGRRDQKPWLVAGESIVQEVLGLGGDHIAAVLVGVVLGGTLVAHHGRVPIVVRIRADDKIGPGEPVHIGGIVVAGGMAIPELADIVRVVACILHPDGQVIVVDADLDDLGISACAMVRIGCGGARVTAKIDRGKWVGHGRNLPYGALTSVTLWL